MTRSDGTLRNRGPFRIGDLEAALSIVQGGMGVGISMSGLAAAVANEGGIGVISAACISRTPPYAGKGMSDAQALREDIRNARQTSKGIIGVNIMVALSNFEELCRAASDEEVDIIFAGAGLPLALPSYVRPGSRTRLAPIVSSAKAAGLITKWWGEKYSRLPDAFVVEGPMAGGHLGFKAGNIFDANYGLDRILPEVLTFTDQLSQGGGPRIPVIAGGGIFTGADIRKYLDLGAQAVQMGTRFVTTDECDAPEEFKRAYLDAKQDDIMIIQSPVGMPGRALKNDFIMAMEAGQTSPVRCAYHCITSCKRDKSPYCIADALLASLNGNTQEGLVFVGANAWRLDKVLPVKALIETLEAEYAQVGGNDNAPLERTET
jgi:nitronate monooxygenase